MTITITASGAIVKPTKTRKPAMRKPRKGAAEKRIYPKWREGMTTRAYIEAYHAANASIVLLTQTEYLCN